MNNEEQQFLNSLNKQLWDAADRLRSAVNPSEYMHVVLGLVFLKYISDAFKEPASTYTRPQHPDLCADFIMANPPFNMKAWKEGVRDDDPRWKYGVLRDFKPEDTAKVANTFHAWQRGTSYTDEAGFCKAVKLDDIRKADYVLTPGRYVGAAAQEVDAEPFEEKMARLTAALGEQFKESGRLEAEIRKNLAGLGYEL